MDIEIKHWTDSDYQGNDGETMSINGKHRLSVLSLCEYPEDAIIGRDLIDCCQISRLMAEAHDAGVKGEKLNINIIETKDRDELFG